MYSANDSTVKQTLMTEADIENQFVTYAKSKGCQALKLRIDGSDGDGMDDFPDSMLDFAFVAGPAKDWQPVSNVIVRGGDFPDDETTSDHRPIELL